MPDGNPSTATATVIPLQSVMSEAQYDIERAKLCTLYGDGSDVELRAKRDQAWAVLFYKSGWTQQKLADKEGKDQSYIARRLLFGRFLQYMPIGIKAESLPKNLTEGRFRALWEQTDKDLPKEEYRFRDVLKLLQSEAIMAPRRPPIGKKIRDSFADGKWHSLTTISEKLDADLDHVRDTLDGVKKNQNYDCRAEKKGTGAKASYRIFKLDRAISSTELLTKLTPIVEGLEEQGRKNMATMSPATVAVLAGKLRNLLNEWSE